MDNLTHMLTGFALARTALSRVGPGATLAVILGSNLPDLDLVTALAGSVTYLQHHREISHSVVGVPVLALGLAGILRAAYRQSRFLPLLACVLTTSAFHVFMDLWTSYGTRVLAPFERTWYAWDWLFIMDPLVLLLLTAVLLLARGPRAPRVATAGIVLLLGYVGLRADLHRRAVEAIAHQLPPSVHGRIAAIPTPLDPTRWKAVADLGDSFLTGEVRVLHSSTRLTRRLKRPEDPLVARVRGDSPLAAAFLDFSPFPWLEVRETPEGTTVQWSDLRYERAGEERFVARIVVTPDGRIRSEKLRF